VCEAGQDVAFRLHFVSADKLTDFVLKTQLELSISLLHIKKMSRASRGISVSKSSIYKSQIVVAGATPSRAMAGGQDAANQLRHVA
jgi:hypothetical protein